MNDIYLKCPACGDFKEYDATHCADCLRNITYRASRRPQFTINDEYSQAAAYRKIIRTVGSAAIEKILSNEAVVLPHRINGDHLETVVTRHVSRREDGSSLPPRFFDHAIGDVRIDTEATDPEEHAKNAAVEAEIDKSEHFNFIIPALKMAWRQFQATNGLDAYAHMKVAIATYLHFAQKQIHQAEFIND